MLLGIVLGNLGNLDVSYCSPVMHPSPVTQMDVHPKSERLNQLQPVAFDPFSATSQQLREDRSDCTCCTACRDPCPPEKHRAAKAKKKAAPNGITIVASGNVNMAMKTLPCIQH